MPSSFSITDTGRTRNMNQDYVFTSDIPLGTLPNLYIVADGMGGHNAGDFASRFTVDTVSRFVMQSEAKDAERVLKGALRAANAGLREEAEKDPSLYGMGTTFVSATILGETLLAANVGDSRLYVLHETDEIRQITRDHSLVEEMIETGRIERGTAAKLPEKNIITRAVGAEDSLKIDFFRFPVSDGDIILLCSDGLTNMLDDSTIAKIVFSTKSLEKAADRLVREANMAGGKDNISVVLVDPYDRGHGSISNI